MTEQDCCGNRETCTRDPHDCGAIEPRSQHTWLVTHWTLYRSVLADSTLSIDDAENAAYVKISYRCGYEGDDRMKVKGCGKRRSLLRKFDADFNDDLRNDVISGEQDPITPETLIRP